MELAGDIPPTSTMTGGRGIMATKSSKSDRSGKTAIWTNGDPRFSPNVGQRHAPENRLSAIATRELQVDALLG